jgi:RecA/RadA recombinase
MSLLDTTLTKLKKEYGEAIADVNVSGVVSRIPVSSPNMNYILGGGIPRGRISVLMGQESGGKCYSPDTKVLTNSGYKSFKELFSKQGIILDTTEKIIPVETDITVLNHEGNWSKISNFTKNGVKETKIVETRSGIKVQATLNNPFLVAMPNGVVDWKNLEDITTEDYLIQHRTLPYVLETWNEEAYLLGVLIADGYFNKNFIAITNDDPVIISMIETVFEKYIGGIRRGKNTGNSANFRSRFFNDVHNFYIKYGLSAGIAKNKKVPPKVFSENKDFIASFLMGYFDCESHIDSKSLEVSSASKQLLEEISLLLNNLGYRSFLRNKKVKSYPNNWYGKVSIYSTDLQAFVHNIGFKSKVKEEQTKNFIYKNGTNHDSIPLSHDLFLEILLSIKKRTRETWTVFSEVLDRRCNASFHSLHKVYNYLIENTYVEQAQRIKEFIETRYYYDKVVGIEDGGSIITCDIEVLDSHSFVANGVIAHNTVLASYLAGQVQKQKDYPNVVAFIDMECAFDRDYASVVGLDTEDDSKFIFIRPKHGEEAFEIMRNLAETGEIGMFVYDSVAATPSIKSLSKEVGSACVGPNTEIEFRMIE